MSIFYLDKPKPDIVVLQLSSTTKLLSQNKMFIWYSALIGCFGEYEYKLMLKSFKNI